MLLQIVWLYYIRMKKNKNQPKFIRLLMSIEIMFMFFQFHHFTYYNNLCRGQMMKWNYKYVGKYRLTFIYVYGYLLLQLL